MLEFPKLTCHLAIGYITKVEFSERSSHYTTANVMHMHQQRMVFFFFFETKGASEAVFNYCYDKFD